MSHEYLGEYEGDYLMGYLSLQECYLLNLALARVEQALQSTRPEPTPEPEEPRDVRTCKCGHVDDAEYGETCQDCGRWLCLRCAPSPHSQRQVGAVVCFPCGCARAREEFRKADAR